jgi:AraC-like DNA-binding protein
MKACELLADFNSKIMEVSEKTGFSNTNTFIRVFKKRMGITPAEFRKREYGPDMA